MRRYPACFLLMLVLAFGASADSGQTDNIRSSRSFGLSLNVGGAVFGGLSMDLFATPRLNLELAAGLGVAGGLRYHWNGSDPTVRWSPYLGCCFGMIPDIDIDIFGDGGDSGWRPNVYLPLGIHYIADSGFALAVEGGVMHGFETDDDDSFTIPMGMVKAGWHF